MKEIKNRVPGWSQARQHLWDGLTILKCDKTTKIGILSMLATPREEKELMAYMAKEFRKNSLTEQKVLQKLEEITQRA